MDNSSRLTVTGLRRWVEQIQVPTKDAGLTRVCLWGSQRALLRALIQAIQQNRRQVVILKGRQVGCTLLLQLLTIRWLLEYPGLQAAFIADSEENREYFRTLHASFLRQLLGTEDTEGAYPGVTVQRQNQTQLVLSTDSRLLYQVAGARTSQRLGVGRGIAWLHATEVSRWPDGRAVTYLRASFSRQHPASLYCFESTAMGRNWWWDLWHEAQQAPGMFPVFLGWWLRDDYRLTGDAFRQWDRPLSRRERHWVTEVERRWRVRLDPQRLAWRRWFVSEVALGDERLADQEMPTLPEDAFEATSSGFLPRETLHAFETAVEHGPAPTGWAYRLAPRQDECRVEPVDVSQANLLTWEAPDPHGLYVVAAVPSYSAQPDEPTAVISVWRAEPDRLIQVAEFVEHDLGFAPTAWVILDLLSLYSSGRRTFIIELAGTGNAVWQELQRLRTTVVDLPLRRAWASTRSYLWRRPDSLGVGGAWQWKSSPDYRTWLFFRFRDRAIRGELIPRSRRLLEECERLRMQGSQLTAEGLERSEHVLHAAALAVESWAGQLVPFLRRELGPDRGQTVTERLLNRFWRSIGATR